MEIITVKDLNIAFNDNFLFRNLNFEISSEEFVLLRGENGSGKTSLVKALIGEIPVNSGELLIEGTPLTQNTELFKIISYVSASAKENFVSGFVEDELLMPQIEQGIKRKVALDNIERILRFFDIEQLRKCNISSLSGGEKQLVAIASSLLCNAKLLILDEALSALDSFLKEKTFNKIIEYVKMQHSSLLFITNESCFFDCPIFKKIINLSNNDEVFEYSPLYKNNLTNVKLLELVNFKPLIKKHPLTAGVNFSLNEGECLVLTGDSGTGKTLLINAIAGFEKFDGKINFENNLSPKDIKILFQDAENYLLKNTVKDELEKVQTNPLYNDILKKANLLDKLDYLVTNLSTGEKRILALCEILLTKPKILILDEIFSNLSAKSLKIVFNLLKTFTNNNNALIIVEHNLEAAKLYSSNIIEINKKEKNLYIEKNVTLGKYIYKNTIIHKTPALIKILITIAFIFLSFLAKDWWHFIVLGSFYLLVVALSLTNPLKLIKPTLGLWIFAVFILVLNGLTINWIEGTKIFLRLTLINVFVPILTLTTSPYQMINAFPIKLVPFKFFKKFVSKIQLIMVTSLLSLESGSIVAKNAMRWQKNLGISYKGSKLKTKIQNLSEVLILLFRYLIINAKTLSSTLYLKGACYRWYTK